MTALTDVCIPVPQVRARATQQHREPAPGGLQAHCSCFCSWSPLQVFVHPLQRVDMRATVGQQSSTTLALAGGSVDRLVAAYSSAPGELLAAPGTLSLPAGGMSALGLVFTPRSLGQQRVSRGSGCQPGAVDTSFLSSCALLTSTPPAPNTHTQHVGAAALWRTVSAHDAMHCCCCRLAAGTGAPGGRQQPAAGARAAGVHGRPAATSPQADGGES